MMDFFVPFMSSLLNDRTALATVALANSSETKENLVNQQGIASREPTVEKEFASPNGLLCLHDSVHVLLQLQPSTSNPEPHTRHLKF